MDNEKYTQELEKMDNVIWETRKSRINAECRLLAINSFVQHINIYYACLSAAIAIISLWYTDKALTMLGAILAPIVTICIVFLNSQRYEQRANSFKQNYIELQKLLYDIRLQKLEPKYNKESIEKLQNRYCELMTSVENHRPCDYARVIVETKEKTSNATKCEKNQNQTPSKKNYPKYGPFPIEWCYYGSCVCFWIIRILSYSAPLTGYIILEKILNQ